MRATLEKAGALAEAEKCRPRYVDGLELGFRLRKPSAANAPKELQAILERVAPSVDGQSLAVFKTHDIAAKDFDGLCDAISQLRIVTVHRDFKDVVVSRFFYYRYYWPSDNTLGPMSSTVAQAMARISTLGDRAALQDLLKARLFANWAREWAAFETQFDTPRALRVSYEGLSDGSEFARLQRFVGRPLATLEPFTLEQRMETQVSGRVGRERFNRQGTPGQWQNWFTPAEAERLDEMTRAALSAVAVSRSSPTELILA